jgi:hypothetical protein
MQGEAEHALRCRPPFKSTPEDLIEEVLLGSLPSSRHGFEELGTIQAGSSPTLVPMVRRPR